MSNSHHKSIILISTLMIIIVISIVFIYYTNTQDNSSYFSPITSSNLGTQGNPFNVLLTFAFIIIVILGLLTIKILK